MLAVGWVMRGRQHIVAFGYAKLLCLLFNLLGLMQAKSWLGLRTLAFFVLCLLQIPLGLLALALVSELKALF